MLRQFVLVLAALFVALTSTTASGQNAETDKALSALRDRDRTPVVQLVNTFLQYQRSKSWELLYDLFSPTYTHSTTRVEYVQTRQAWTAQGRIMYIVDFTPRRVLVNDLFDGQYSFVGCANVFRDGRIQFTNAHIDVVLENNVWRIADYSMFAECLPPDWECKE